MEQIDILNDYCNFSTEFDVYVLFGIARKKDNENITNSQEVVFREVIKSKDNIEKKYMKILTKCQTYRTGDNNKLNFYIYCSVNARDVRKGYITFKNKMLSYEREMMYGVSCSNQLKRIDSMWLSAIMEPCSRSKNRKFMVDIDTKDDLLLTKISTDLNKFTTIVLQQETLNGWHYIVEPFDKSLVMNFDFVEIKTDSLFYLDHIGVN